MISHETLQIKGHIFSAKFIFVYNYIMYNNANNAYNLYIYNLPGEILKINDFSSAMKVFLVLTKLEGCLA